MKSLIIAGNITQYEDFLKTHKLQSDNNIYISKPEDLSGLGDDFEIIYTGTWWKNKLANAPEIDILQTRLANQGKLAFKFK